MASFYPGRFATMVLLLFLLFVAHFRKMEAYEGDIDCIHCPEYQQAPASEKEEIIFDKIVSTEYAKLGLNLPEFLSLCESFEFLQGVDFNNQFDRFSDFRPSDFQRFFHRSGIISKVKWEAAENNHNFTGLFKGADHGVIRLSPLAPLLQEKYLMNYFLGTFLFSFGVKFFRDSMHSGNIMTGDTAKGFGEYTNSRAIWDRPDFNIFSRPLDTMPGLGDTVGGLFGENEVVSGLLSAADFAAYDEAGNLESSPKTPLIVYFEPNQELKDKFGIVSKIDFRRWTTTEEAVPTGTLLYTVYTTVLLTNGEPSLCVDDTGTPQVDEDVSTFCPEQQVIELGQIITTSRFYASKWPDDSLFFQHTRVCPKDQVTCKEDTATSYDPQLDTPDTTYANDNGVLCRSSDDESGEITGVLPACPNGYEVNGSSAEESDTYNYCYPDQMRVVETTQVNQCPFASLVSDSIKDPEPTDDPPGCDLGYELQNFFLTLALDLTIPLLRLLPEVVLDNVILPILDLLPFGGGRVIGAYRYH